MVGSMILVVRSRVRQSWFTSERTSTSESIFFLGIHFGHGDQQVILERGIILAEVVTAEDAMLEQMRVDLGCGPVDSTSANSWKNGSLKHSPMPSILLSCSAA